MRSRDHGEHLAAQKAFYASRDHAHLRPANDDAYALKLARELVSRSGIDAGHSVLEAGAGFGRFTFPLLEACGSVVAFDLSERALEDLAAHRDRRGIPAGRCRTLCGDLSKGLDPDADDRFDFIVGFFILHHLADVEKAISALSRSLKPSGRMVFLEPNRRNPLYLAQIMACRDMTWRDERGMFRLSERSVARAYRAAGLDPLPVTRFGFFPPQVFNRFPAARRVEGWLERRRWLDPFLPFLVLTGRKPGP